MKMQDTLMGLAFAAMVSAQWVFIGLAGATPAMA